MLSSRIVKDAITVADGLKQRNNGDCRLHQLKLNTSNNLCLKSLNLVLVYLFDYV